MVESYIGRIQQYDSLYNAFITTRYKDALKEAEVIERRIRNGIYLGPLDGIPFALKDIIHVKGVRCTAGSKILRNFVPKKDAYCVSKLKNAGAILIGTTNLNEFASGITGINPHYGNSRNPWNRDRISGGSSGGSCVSVSVGMVPFSLGTDTGGSIRVPSAYCGIVGIKPTYDIISRDGIINLAPALDHIGCMTRSSWDAAVVLKVLIQDSRFKYNSKCVDSLSDIIAGSSEKAKKLTLGIPSDYFLDSTEPEIEKCLHKFLNIMESSNCAVNCVSIEGTKQIYKTWKCIRLSEASEQHRKWIFGRGAEYSPEVREMINEGLEIRAVDYIYSFRLKNRLTQDFLRTLKKADVLVTPTIGITAPKFSSFKTETEKLNLRRALLKNSIPFNLNGFPAVTIPVGFDRFGIPVGIQIIGKPYHEGTILSVANTFEKKNNSLDKFIPKI